jgi:hypothetical protein
MNKFVIRIMLILFLLTGGILATQAEEINKPQKPEGGMKPPPEAITACEGKSKGTAVQFTTPRGDTLKGICKQFEGILADMPERGAPPPRGNKPDEAKSGRQAD